MNVTQPTASNLPTSQDLTQIIQAYNTVTEKLQKTHEQLSAEVVRLREELASTNAQLQRSKRLAALGEMAAGIAHEIRNPLAAIQLYCGMLHEDLAHQKPQQEVAGKIDSVVRGLESVVTDVLTFSNEMKPDMRMCNVLELFARAIDIQKPSILKHKILIDDEGIDESLELLLDPDLIHRALTNVIRNAIEAMSRTDDPILTLSVTFDPKEQIAKLSIRDNGPGIDAQDIDRIFNPFFTTRNIGTGLGLAIVHRIIDAHGGSILVANDHGAIFELLLPLQLISTSNKTTSTSKSENLVVQGVHE